MEHRILNPRQADDLALRIRQRWAEDRPASYDGLGGQGAPDGVPNGGEAQWGCPSPNDQTGVQKRPQCYRKGMELCDMQHIGASILAVAANSAWGPMLVVPTVSQYFEPAAVEMLVTENGNANATRRVRITAVTIQSSPQEPIDNRAPVVGTTAFFWSDHFTRQDYGPTPVGWGMFSVAALTKDLQVFGFNPNGVIVDIEMMVYGNALDGLTPRQQQSLGKVWRPYYAGQLAR